MVIAGCGVMHQRAQLDFPGARSVFAGLKKFLFTEAIFLSDCFFKGKWHFNKLCNKSVQHTVTRAITNSFGDKPYIIVYQILPLSVFYVSTSLPTPQR